MTVDVDTKQGGSVSTESNTGLVVVSMDAHVAPPVDHYRPYVEKQYLDRFDEFAAAFGERMAEHPGAGSPFNEFDVEPSERSKHYWNDIETRFNTLEQYADPNFRLQTMDADGIAAEVSFHGGFNRIPQPFFSPELGGIFGEAIPQSPEAAELRAAGIRAYNRWLADYGSADPDRLIGVAYIPIWDIDATLAELKHMSDLGLSAINFPAPKAGLRTYNVEAYEPFWATCVEHGMTLHTHVASGDSYTPDYGPGYFSIFLSEVEYLSRRHLWQMIFGGVFERHSALKLTLTEQSGLWETPMLDSLDSAYLAKNQERGNPYIRDVLPRLPSEYFASNISVAASFASRFEVQGAIDGGYSQKLMWGRDFPHPEGTWPCTRESMRSTFAGFPDELVRSVLGETAVNFLDLDAKALEVVATKVGPTMDEVQTPFDQDQVPPEGWLSSGFRKVGPFA